MNNITEAQAREVAIKLTIPKQKELEEVRNKSREYFTELYLSTLPEGLMEAFKKHPSFFRTRETFLLHGNGFNWQKISASKNVPCSSNIFTPSPEESKKLLLLLNLEEARHDELKRLIIDIEVALNALGTFKRIHESFPEVSKYLSSESKLSTASALNLSELREKLR